MNQSLPIKVDPVLNAYGKQIEEKALNKLGITGKGLKKFLEKNESAY